MEKYEVGYRNFEAADNDNLFKKPLFCWMIAIIYKDKDNGKLFESGKVKHIQTLLYSSFIHTIVKGKYAYYHNDIELRYEKWALRKIAALKSIYPEIKMTDLIDQLKNLAVNEGNKGLIDFITSQDYKDNPLFPLVDTYFLPNGSKQIEFIHRKLSGLSFV